MSPMHRRPSIPVWQQPGTAAWYEGPVLGNGDLGVIAWGNQDLLNFGVGKNDVWDRRNDAAERRQFMTFQEYLHRAAEVRREDEFYPTNVVPVIDKPGPERSPSPKPVCRIEVRGRHLAPVTHELALETATLRTRAAGLTIESRVQRDRNVVMLDFKSVDHPIEVRLLRDPDPADPSIPPATHRWRDDRALIVQDFPADPVFPSGFRCAVAAKMMEADPPTCNGRSLVWRVNGPTTLLLAAVTTRDEALDPLAAAERLLETTIEQGEASLGCRHTSWWKTYWDASWVRLDHERAQTYWYLNNYFIASAARAGAVAPALFGPWIVNERSGWGGAYTTDYNVEQAFAGVLSSNHPELMWPYIEMLEAALPAARDAAKTVFGSEGIAYASWIFPGSMLGRWHGDSSYVCVTPYVVQHIWDYYRYTGDREFLEKRGYELIAGCADFLAGYATRDERGRYQFFPTRSTEHHAIEKGLPFHRNQIAELAFARWAFGAAIEASRIVAESNAARVGRWREVLAGLLSWPTYRTQAGEVFVDCEAQPVDRNFTPPTPLPPRRDDEHYSAERRAAKQVHNDGAWMIYTCPTPIWPVYPAAQIDADSPAREQLTAVRTWMTLRTEGANDIITRYVAAARLGMPLLDAFLAEIEPTLLPNGSFSCMFFEKAFRHDPKMVRTTRSYGVYTENFGFPVVLNEMMLQSHRGVIKLFPAVDPHLTAEFHRLRTVGGFLVSAEVDRGWVRWARIEPTVAGPCRVRAFGPPHCIELVETTSGRRVSPRIEGCDLVFEAQPGQVFELTPRPMTGAKPQQARELALICEGQVHA